MVLFGADGDELLGQDIEGITHKPDRLDLCLEHELANRDALEQICLEARHQDTLAGLSDPMASSAHPLETP